MLRRVKHERRVKNSEPERRKDLDEEQDRCSLRSRGEPASDKLHPPLFRSLRPCRVKPPMTSGAEKIGNPSDFGIASENFRPYEMTVDISQP